MHVLFVCNRLAPTLELSHVVKALQEQSDFKPVVLIGSKVLQSKLPAMAFGNAPQHLVSFEMGMLPSVHASRAWGLASKVARFLKLDSIADFFLVMRAVSVGDKVFSQLRKKYQFSSVIVADDRSLGFEFGIMRAAKIHKVPSVAVPFALSDPDADWLRRAGRVAFDVDAGPYFSKILKQRVAEMYPENIRSKTGRRLMFLTAGQVLGLHFFKHVFCVPWAYGGGGTDVATVYDESIRKKQLYLGIAPEKLEVTGQCALDGLYRMSLNRKQMRTELISRHNLKANAPLLLCAVPQHGEHGMMEHKEHEQMTRALFDQLRDSGANVILSLHPRSDPAVYEGAANTTGAIISRQPLIEIITCADIFVATHSSTVRWAILLNIPTVVLDDFNVGGNGMFQRDKVQIVKERSSLGGVLSLLMNNIKNSDMGTNAANGCDATDLFDGMSGARLVALLDKLTDRTQPVRAKYANSQLPV